MHGACRILCMHTRNRERLWTWCNEFLLSAYKRTATGYIIVYLIGTFTAMVMRGAFGGPVGRVSYAHNTG